MFIRVMTIIIMVFVIGANVQAEPYITGTYQQIAEGYQLSFVVHNAFPVGNISSWFVVTTDAIELQAPEGWSVSLQTREVSWSANEFVYSIQPFESLGGFNFVASNIADSYGWSLYSTSGVGGCDGTVTLTPEPIPEPSSILALAGGLIGVGGFALRRRR